MDANVATDVCCVQNKQDRPKRSPVKMDLCEEVEEVFAFKS